MLDPIVRFQNSEDQPTNVNKEKKETYEPWISFLAEKYRIKD